MRNASGSICAESQRACLSIKHLPLPHNVKAYATSSMVGTTLTIALVGYSAWTVCGW